MKEFGSDFHFIDNYNSCRAHLTDVHRDATLLADGRQCIVVLIRQYGWKRIWMPDYFCYEVIDTIKEQTGIEVVFYEDNPLNEGQVENLPFGEEDVLLRMNFFGMRGQRNNKKITCPVIEDHTHDLMGHWALYSDADWCISSLRKTLPIPEGGMLWSPKGLRLPAELVNTADNRQISKKRWLAMQMKRDYLHGTSLDKEAFRKLYVETEEWFDTADVSLIDEHSCEYIRKFDINAWLGAKQRNWKLLRKLISDKVQILLPEDDSCTMFSLVILTENQEQRNRLRKGLIERAVYPAILWQVPDSASKEAKDFSQRMLSIHCDGRYTEDDIRQQVEIINQTIES